MTIAIKLTNSNGIRIFTARSRPRVTPFDTTKITKHMKRLCQKAKRGAELVKASKTALDESRSEAKSPDTLYDM